MPYGYVGKILHVNLTDGRSEVEEPDQAFYRTYMGGRNVAAYYLLRMLPRHIDPLSPRNVLVFATSVLTGAPFPGSGRYTVAAKSPLTGTYGESEAGGFFGPELKFAGFDALVLTGAADSPKYLLIDNGSVELRPAEHLWGMSTADAEDHIRRELGAPDVRIACIGQAGENLVRYAAVLTDAKHVNGRTGMGAVMGSKKLKAVVVRGKNRLPLADEKAVIDKARWFARNFKANTVNRTLFDIGTPSGVAALNAVGKLPTRNFRDGQFEGADEISGERMKEILFSGQEGCFACPVRCKHVVRVDGGPHTVDPRYGGIEYESIAALGSNCGIADVYVVAKANELCNRYGLDTISTGATLAFLMECTERGIEIRLGNDTVSPRFGDGETLLRLITDIAYRRGVGDILAEGVKRLADYLGNGAAEFAMHAKGGEIAMHEPRGKVGVGLGYAVSPIGGDHLQAEHDDCFADRGPFLDHLMSLGIQAPLDPLDFSSEKIRMFTYLQIVWSFYNVLDICAFVGPPGRTFSFKDLVDIVGACTGWDTSLWELMKAGERGLNLLRCFNVREGFGRDDDCLPPRFHTSFGRGPLQGRSISHSELSEAITKYYGMMGWTLDSGVPSRYKLAELGIEWAADLIESS